VENGEYPYLDAGLENQIPSGTRVLRNKINEPYKLYRSLSGQKQKVDPTIFSSTNQSFLKRMMIWIRGNLFIPDPRIFWVRPSVKYLSEFLVNNSVDAIVSTGPPHSMHLIARKLHKRFNIPWLADFRDPWTQIYSFDQMHMSFIAKKIHRILEQKVLKESNLLVTVSNHCKKDLERIAKREVKVITNGYEEFNIPAIVKTDDAIRMLYAGALSMDRNPKMFWQQLIYYLKQHPEIKNRFQLWMIGSIDQQIIEELKLSELSGQVFYLPAIPHSELQYHLSLSDLLLLIGVPGHPGVVTGKLFEYLYMRKPILSISPEASDVVDILNETCTGFNADFNDEAIHYENIVRIFEMIANKSFKPSLENIEKYSRKQLTKKLSELLNQITEIKP
jgi:glycosyltransferase involved in cell wall biosynthesis